MSNTNISINGAGGRMGLAIKALLDQDNSTYNIVALLDRNSTKEEILSACKNSDVMLDFSHPDALELLLDISSKTEIKVLVGTTGLQDKHHQLIEKFAQTNAILLAANTSIVSNLVSYMSASAAKILADYDVEIIEAHHRYKKDAPSGTALHAGKEIAAARGVDFDSNAVFARAPESERKEEEIGFSVIRGGKIPGEHEVIIAGDNDLLKIGCRALSRDSFAAGAIKIADWLKGSKPGFYSMKDFMNLS